MISIEINWLYIPFAIFVVGLVALLIAVLSNSQGAYDFGTPLMGCGIFFILLLVIAIFGGLLWW